MNEIEIAQGLFRGEIDDEEFRQILDENSLLDTDVILKEYNRLERKKTLAFFAASFLFLTVLAFLCFLLVGMLGA